MQYQDSSGRFTIAKDLIYPRCHWLDKILRISFVLLFFLRQRGDFHERERERAACWNNEKRKSEKGGKGIRREDWWEGEGGVENLGRRIALVPYGGETGCNGLRIATIEEFSLPFKRTR